MNDAKQYIAVDLGAESSRVMLGSVSTEEIRLEEIHRFVSSGTEEKGSLRWDFKKLLSEIKVGIGKAVKQADTEICGIGIDTWGSDYIDDVTHVVLDKFQQESSEGAEKAMDRVCKEQLQGCPNFQRKIISGEPATEILKMIESEGIDLVVMGTHGRKGLEHTIFGSVAENVVKKSPVPVLTVNPYKHK